MSQSYSDIMGLFEAAVSLETQAQQVDFLSRACPDLELRREVEALLVCHQHPDRIFTAPPTRDTATATEEVGTIIDRYKLVEQVGEGGCGVVYVAEQTEPIHRKVALKVIKLGMDTKSVVARFEGERQALSMMDHPNIAKILDAGTTSAGRPYFVMELVRGIPITDYCDQACLNNKERLDLFVRVCHAIQHAHQKGIIHRDIKPSNILITLHDGVPVPRVIDFGIAKAIEGRLTDKTVHTQLHQFIGTPTYMSPEQAEMSGLDIDTRSDIYSLGALLYELLVGKPPFDSKDLEAIGLDAIRKTIQEREPEQPSTKLAALQGEELTSTAKRHSIDAEKLSTLLRGDLDWIVMKCLEKDRTRRYHTANGIAGDIQNHLNNEPISACPPSAMYRFQKAFRRNKITYVAAAAIVTALGIGATVSTWQAIKATRAIHAESEQRIIAENAKTLAESLQHEAEGATLIAEKERQRADAQAKIAVAGQKQSRRFLYVADMNLAHQALKLNNVGRTRRLLERHRPKNNEEDLRGWEWRYLWQQTRSTSLITLTNRPTPGFSLSFSPDGHHLAVGWFDGQIDMWDVSNRTLQRSIGNQGNPYYQGRVAFSPTRNLVAFTSEYKVITLQNLESGIESTVWQAPEEGWWSVRDISFSPDGSRLAIYAGSAPQIGAAVWVIDVTSNKIEKRYPTVSNMGYYYGATQLSPDGNHLFLARSDPAKNGSTIHCLDLEADQERWQSELQTDPGITNLAISPDGRILASSSGFNDPNIRIWNTANGKLVRQLKGHTSWVSDLAFTKDGRQLISSGTDQTIRVWDTENWTTVRVLRGHHDEVFAIAFSQDSQIIASTSKDGDLMLWDAEGDSSAVTNITLPRITNATSVLPIDDGHLLFLSPEHFPELVNLKRDSDPKVLPQIGSSTNILGYSKTGLLFTWNGKDHILVQEWNGKEFGVLKRIPLGSGLRPGAFAYYPERQLLAWTKSPSTKTISLSSLSTPNRRIELISDVGNIVFMHFGEDGLHLAAATEGKGSARVWNIETGQLVASINEPIVATTFGAGGKMFFTGLNASSDILFYDLSHPTATQQRSPGEFACWSLTASPDGSLVAGTTLGGKIRLLNAVTGELEDTLHGHMHAIVNSAFSKDGRRMISTSASGQQIVKLWDLDTRQELLTLDGVAGYGFWGSDGNTFFVGDVRQKGGVTQNGGAILIGDGLQAWRAPSWQEIAIAEAYDR